MNEELKSLLEKKIAEHNYVLQEETFNNIDHEDELFDKQVARQKELVETMNAALKTILAEDSTSVEFNDEFYKSARECLTMKAYELYDGLKLAEGVTEEELKPFEAQIAAGNLAALGGLVEKDAMYVSKNYAVFVNFRAIITNFRFFTLTLAHRAKHFGSFAAGEKFLRATSILSRFEHALSEIDEESVEQMLSLLEDGLEDLAIAADYHNMPSWDEYLKDAKARILG